MISDMVIQTILQTGLLYQIALPIVLTNIIKPDSFNRSIYFNLGRFMDHGNASVCQLSPIITQRTENANNATIIRSMLWNNANSPNFYKLRPCSARWGT